MLGLDGISRIGRQRAVARTAYLLLVALFEYLVGEPANRRVDCLIYAFFNCIGLGKPPLYKPRVDERVHFVYDELCIDEHLHGILIRALDVAAVSLRKRFAVGVYILDKIQFIDIDGRSRIDLALRSAVVFNDGVLYLVRLDARRDLTVIAFGVMTEKRTAAKQTARHDDRQ